MTYLSEEYYRELFPLVKDECVTEIMVNGCNDVYVERNGKIERTEIAFQSNEKVMSLIERLVSQVNRRIDESSPMVDARMGDGSRLNAIINPVSIDGPALTIRRFNKNISSMNELVEYGMVSDQVAEFLQRCVEDRISMVISGGTSSGKTTLLGVLASFIPKNERIITIEDSAELSLISDHVVRLESRPPNIEGAGEITIRQLVKNALRMRPDRIVVGECRGAEALDMLQAMNTGHEGSLTTVHANTARDAVARLETMVLMADVALPIWAIRQQIVSSVKMIVQLERNRDGQRRIAQIAELTGMEGDVPSVQILTEPDEDSLSPVGLNGLRPKFNGDR